MHNQGLQPFPSFLRSYGEAIFLAFQTVSIAFLVCVYSEQLAKGLAYVSIYVGVMGFLLSPSAPLSLLAVLQAGNIFTVSVSKVSQQSNSKTFFF